LTVHTKVSKSAKVTSKFELEANLERLLDTVPEYRPVRHSVRPRSSVIPVPSRKRIEIRRAEHKNRKFTHTVDHRQTRKQSRWGGIDELVAASLLNQYSPLVRQIVGGFQRKLPRNVLRDDLLAAGMSGLWDAIRRQGGQCDESFEWYVRVRIRGAILDELRAQDWLPRRARAAAAEAMAAGNTSILPPSVVRLDDVSEWEQGRALSSAESNSSESAVHHKLVGEALQRAVDQLPERERHIVAMHYFRGIKFKDLGTELGVSEPRISQLHSRAMKRLRTIIAQQAA
jgi:RNA polymerase sigma factor for flagellar operon FliA